MVGVGLIIENRESDGKDDRIEWWSRDDFYGRRWKLKGKVVRVHRRKGPEQREIPPGILVCGQCGGKLSFPCPVYHSTPLCQECFYGEGK